MPIDELSNLRAVADAAREAMNASTDALDTINLPSHLAAALSLTLDDLDKHAGAGREPADDLLSEYRRANQAHSQNPNEESLVCFQEAANAIYRELASREAPPAPALAAPSETHQGYFTESPAQAVQRPAGLDPNESDPYVLWAEIARLQAAVRGPDDYASWQDAATAERIRRVKAERALTALARELAPPAFVPTLRHEIQELRDKVAFLETEAPPALAALTDEQIASLMEDADCYAQSAVEYQSRREAHTERECLEANIRRVLAEGHQSERSETVAGLSWSGHNIKGDEESIRVVKAALHDAGLVPQLRALLAEVRAKENGNG